ncbi:MAG: DUF2723 domain-containing protein [Chloroflexota bacterium]|nr:DUF2723 domain-containing protein [Chloroflexota bacterium]
MRRLSRLPILPALLPAAGAVVLYGLTLSPTINFLDSGELTTVAWTAGIAHPPGYPLYTLISSAFIHLPFGEPAWRMNLLSALFGALAVGLFYRLVAMNDLSPNPSPTKGGEQDGRRADPTPCPAPEGREGSESVNSPFPTKEGGWGVRSGALAAAGLLATSLTFWNWATQAKMYTLHFAFVAALFGLALHARRALIAEMGGRPHPPTPSPKGRGGANRPLPPTPSPFRRGGVSRPIPRQANAAKTAPPATTVTIPQSALRNPQSGVPQSALRNPQSAIRLLAFVLGLAVTNHSTTYLLLPGLAVLLLAPLPGGRWPLRRLLRDAPALLACGLGPLLLYAYLPLRAGMEPLMNWGSPSTFGDFWRHVSGWQFQVYIGQQSDQLGSYIRDAAVFALNQFGWGLTALLLVPLGAGLVRLWRTDRVLLAATALTAAVVVLFTLNYQIREVVVYYVPAYMMALWWVGLGVEGGVATLRARLSALRLAPAWALGALLPLLALVANWGAAGHQGDYLEERYVQNAFANFRPNAVVVTDNWDLVSGAYYQQWVRGQRPDVTLVDTSLLRYPFYVNYLERQYPALVAKVPPWAAYKALDRHWADNSTGFTQGQQLTDLYLGVINGLLDNSGRPGYIVYPDQAIPDPAAAAGRASPEGSVLARHAAQLVPDGLGYRIAPDPSDRAIRDPAFDLRGLLTDPVALDEVAYSVTWVYPHALDTLAAALQASPTLTDGQLAARLAAQAQALAPFAANPQSTPRLR